LPVRVGPGEDLRFPQFGKLARVAFSSVASQQAGEGVAAAKAAQAKTQGGLDAQPGFPARSADRTGLGGRPIACFLVMDVCPEQDVFDCQRERLAPLPSVFSLLAQDAEPGIRLPAELATLEAPRVCAHCRVLRGGCFGVFAIRASLSKIQSVV
jgi:hypothetical protein